MTLMKSQKIIIIIISILFIISLITMIYDYIARPPVVVDETIYRATGNIKGNLYKFIPFIIFEYLLFITLTIYTIGLKNIYRVLIAIVLLICSFFAHILTMEAGGVEAIHALWVTAIFIVFLVISIIPQEILTKNSDKGKER